MDKQEIPKETLSTEQTRAIIRQLYLQWHHDISHYHLGFVQNILQRFLHDSYPDISLLEASQTFVNDKRTVRNFIKRLYIPVSEFFRDPDVFLYIRDYLMNYLESYPIIRIWSAGTAFGEEVYSLAIMLEEWGIYDRCMIYATDACTDSLQQAKLGQYLYNKSFIKGVENYYLSGGKHRFSRYFRIDERKQVVYLDDAIKRNICFSNHNLVQDEVFNHFSLILCRNVFIYFNDGQQQRALDLFHRSLDPFGYLVLGKSESIQPTSDGLRLFEPVDSNLRVFRWKKND